MVAANHSRKVRTSQAGIHPRLEDLLVRYRTAEWAQPYHVPSVVTFEAVQRLLPSSPRPLILDSGCGTGESTVRLSDRYPDSLVIGVDKSLNRLTRPGVESLPHRSGNIVLARAELTTFWRLALRAGWRLERHYLLYPNPWPKPGQLQRRWHAHPVFQDLLALGGRLELRCNWAVYAQEFAFAVNLMTASAVKPESVPEADALSPFEHKYRASGHELYRVVLPDQSNRVN